MDLKASARTSARTSSRGGSGYPSRDLRERWTLTPWAGLRRPTRVVRVGDVAVGGDNPIRIQSMTNTDTMDTRATVDQAERMAAAGCEIVRVTAPSIRDAENLRVIRSELRGRGVDAPLVADIHFTPNAALIAADHVEKVRINPGNYADKKKFEVREYSDTQYAEEIERVAERFRPLVQRCKANGVAMRIGTNHGSLSDRILNRYGDTPAGMVASALEFLDVCEDEGYFDVIFSMKASNAQVAIQAYRLLAARLDERAERAGSGLDTRYPFHVGVTEAGDGEDGRIKSAIGIGSLLEDGIGDTIRVSLTEDPVAEVPVAAALARRCEARWAEDARAAAKALPSLEAPFVDDPFGHERRPTKAVSFGGLDVGGEEPVRVEIELEPSAEPAGVATSLALLEDVACEGLLVRAGNEAEAARATTLSAALAELGVRLPLALRTPASAAAATLTDRGIARAVLELDASTPEADAAAAAAGAGELGIAVEWCLEAEAAALPALVDCALAASGPAALRGLAFSAEASRPTHAVRVLVARLRELGAADCPVVLRHRRGAGVAETDDAVALDAAIDLGASLCDGIGDVVSLEGFGDPARAVDLAYRTLQGARLRTTRTEYISCPSCGRTLFDLEETTARIKDATGDLKGVKIAVMGCIVNGPGEMADADFGYVGSGPGTVSLYVGKQVVARHVPEAEAAERLVELIRQHERWREREA